MPSTPAALALENYIQDFETSVNSSDASSSLCYVPEVSDGCKREQVQVRTAAGRATPRLRHSTWRCLPSMEMPDLTDITTLGGGGLSSPQPEDMLSSVAVDLGSMSPVSASVAAAPRSTQRSRRGSLSTRKHPRSKGPKSRKSTSSSQGGSKSTGLRKKKTSVRTSASDSGTVAASPAANVHAQNIRAILEEVNSDPLLAPLPYSAANPPAPGTPLNVTRTTAGKWVGNETARQGLPSAQYRSYGMSPCTPGEDETRSDSLSPSTFLTEEGDEDNAADPSAEILNQMCKPDPYLDRMVAAVLSMTPPKLEPPREPEPGSPKSEALDDMVAKVLAMSWPKLVSPRGKASCCTAVSTCSPVCAVHPMACVEVRAVAGGAQGTITWQSKNATMCGVL